MRFGLQLILAAALGFALPPAFAQFNGEGVSYFNPRGPADNDFARALAVPPDARFLVLGESYLPGCVLHSGVRILTPNVRLRAIVFTLNFLAVLGIWPSIVS